MVEFTRTKTRGAALAAERKFNASTLIPDLDNANVGITYFTHLCIKWECSFRHIPLFYFRRVDYEQGKDIFIK